MTDAPGYSFTSHIDGKNAKVDIYTDRIEWERKAISGGKVVGAALTFGLSAIATGGVRGRNTEMIPIKAISSISSKKGMGLNTVVKVATSAGLVEFRTSHKEAVIVVDYVRKLMVWDPTAAAPAQAAPAEAAAPVEAAPDHMAQLQQLKGLLDAGVLTQDEYDAKKTEILGRM